jgi:hypothetical protein
MAYLNTRRFGTPELMDIFLKGGIFGAIKLQREYWGMDGLTLVFTSPAAKTVTFSAPLSAPLTPGEIVQQIGLELNDPAVTTEGTTALSSLTMASETLTLYLDGSSTATEVVFGTENGEVAILAVLNAALNPLGVTATAGTGTPGGVVLTTDDGGAHKSIQVAAAGGGQAKLTMAVETQAGAVAVLARFQDERFVHGASSTAGAKFGFGDATVLGIVYAAPDGSAPRFIAATPSGQGDGLIVTTEEA